MAKVTSPLFSLSAQGAVGKTIIYNNSTGGARAIRFFTPRGSGTPARKSLYADGCADWQLLTPPEKAAWKIIGAKKSLSGFSAWMSSYLLNPTFHGVQWDNGAAIWDNGAAIWIS